MSASVRTASATAKALETHRPVFAVRRLSRSSASINSAERGMQYYRLYFIVGGHIARAEELFAENDDIARGVALDRSARQPVELWRGARRVAAFSAAHSGPHQQLSA
jgi:hypothetical protein